MALNWVFIAGLFVALSNLCMRRSIDAGGTTKAFLVVQMAIGALTAMAMGPLRTGHYEVNPTLLALGGAAGLLLGGMLFTLGRALEKGPPGLTFSILNASTVMPGLAMALLFGASLGYLYTVWHALGSLLVLGGLFWAGRGVGELRDLKGWLFFAWATFFGHVFLLILFQLRALLLRLQPEMQSEWFLPAMYAVAGAIQLAIYLKAEGRIPLKEEVFYGVGGGVANSLCSFFLLWGTEVASPLENAVIFPIFSIVSIVLSNIWGQRLYQERVNWRACQLSAFGLFIGTVDWKGVGAALGF